MQMIWANVYILMVIFSLMSTISESGCVRDYDAHFGYVWRCISTDANELMTFFQEQDAIADGLIIEDSNFTYVEILPKSHLHQRVNCLSIKNSGVVGINPKYLNKWFAVSLLDLSRNIIEDVSFLRFLPSGYLRDLDLSHNKIQNVDTNILRNFHILSTVDMSHNYIKKLNFSNNFLRILNLSHNFIDIIDSKNFLIYHILMYSI
ncbi:hypothetical protein HHI36_018423 [Cryptolaemus montrouzieri]|uniref:Uncharacterized protein n=1 Tax=Cryptolaemus montrouzieri TaxID=559131 RepID=A0ABD2P0U9_9CUCU